MRISDPTEKLPAVGRINTFTLVALSLMWAMFLGYISPWFTPLAVICIMISYGSEIPTKRNSKKSETITFN